MTPRLSEETGAGMVEYALLVLFIALVAVISVQLVGNATESMYNNIASAIRN